MCSVLDTYVSTNMNKKYHKELHLSHKSKATYYCRCFGRLSETRTPFSPTRRRSDSTTSMAMRRLLPAQGIEFYCLLHFLIVNPMLPVFLYGFSLPDSMVRSMYLFICFEATTEQLDTLEYLTVSKRKAETEKKLKNRLFFSVIP